MAECVSSTVSKYKSSWGCANSFYYLSAVGGEKAIREFEVACHSLKLLVPDCMCSPFIKPPTTCLSCQWPHWLANSKFKPLPPLPPPCMWPVTVKSPEVGDSFQNTLGTEEQMHRITHLPLYPLQCPRVFFPPLVEQLLRMQLSGPAQCLIVSECIPFMPAQDELACIYEWKWKILLFGTQPAGVIRLLSQDIILMEYLYHEMFSNFCFNYDT